MLVATFGPTTGWAGKTITFDNEQFVLQGHGPIAAQDVMAYDGEGHLLWAYDGLRAWVGGIASASSSVGAVTAASGPVAQRPDGDGHPSGGGWLYWYFAVLKNYAVFRGRARRREYWMFQLFNAIAFFALMFLDAVLGTLVVSKDGAFGTISGLYVLAVFVPTLAVTVRRLHDTEHSGWWVLINWLPFGSLLLLYWTVLDGDPFTNDFGANPKGQGRTTKAECPACTASLGPGAKFCAACGAPATPGPAGL